MKLINSFIFISVLFLVFSCKNNTKQNAVDEAIKIELDKESVSDKTVKKIFLNLPSPIELTNTILSSKTAFDSELLNKVESVEKYTTTSDLALNFGIYGADLCYCRVYDQLQASISYLSSIRKISDKLQIPEDEGAETINRIEENMNNSDSIFHIISETYANADGYLKENEREITATLILVGGWVEGMHFAVNLLNSAGDKDILINKIAEQKYSYQNLMTLIKEAQNDATVAPLIPLFEKLELVYNAIEITYEKPSVITDEKTKVTSIENESEININKDQLKEITELIGEIRTKIIS